MVTVILLIFKRPKRLSFQIFKNVTYQSKTEFDFRLLKIKLYFNIVK